MTDILDEVEGDYRAEQWRAAAGRYAWVAVAALVLVLMGAGAWQYRQSQIARTAQTVGAAYADAAKAADALVAGDVAGRIALAGRFGTLAASAPAGYRTLARLRQAALLASAEQLGRAQAVWDQVSTDPDADPLLRALSSWLWVERGLDTADPAALRTRLVSLTAVDNPYHALAYEAQALLDMRQGQTDAARGILRRLVADPTTPSGVRGRDGPLLSRLGG